MKKLFLTAILISSNAFAWGPIGHRVVGEIAEKHLDVEVLLKVQGILKGESLARVSTWSDEIKSEPQTYSNTFNWHFTDWKDEDHVHDETKSEGKLLTSIREQLAVLKDPAASQDMKAFALKFVVHLVGDVHMPLHVGNGIDRGGNACRVLFHNKETNLHALWDEGMIEFNKLSFTELARFASEGRSASEIVEWRKGDVIDWAQESKDLRASIYPDDVVPSQAKMSIRQYCSTGLKVGKEDMPKLGFEYSYKFVPVVEKRLFQGGLRLARLLNEALK